VTRPHPIRPRALPSATSRADSVFNLGRTSSPRPAFSLIELIIVLVVLAVVSTIAMVRYSSSLAQYRLVITTDKIVADLEWAKARARTTSSEREVRFNALANGYGVPSEPLRPNSSSRYLVDLTQEPYRSKLVSASFGALNSVTFNAFGLPDRAGTIRVSSGQNTRTIRVSQGGTFSVETP
jgi:prepilin-type N-terminal cleavage/methylation domain-containing protein